MDTLRLLLKSCDGRNTEHLDIFIEKYEVAIACGVDTAKPPYYKKSWPYLLEKQGKSLEI